MNTHLQQPSSCFASIPPPAISMITIHTTPYLMLSITTFLLRSHQSQPSMKRNQCPSSLTRMPKFSLHHCLKLFKIRQVPCDIKECHSLKRLVPTYLDPLWSLPTQTLQGGFTTRAHQVRDSCNNYLACKVVTKSSFKTKKAKTKVYAHCAQILAQH
jgi:hypothetical protein